jgi:NADH-quinone oxidoreductase subunit M
LIAVIYIGLVALVQADMKKLVAYSSIAHMGFVTLGFFMFKLSAQDMAMQGGIVQMISHGFVSGAMFLCIGVLYDRMHSRQIADYGGVVNTMPRFAALFFVLFSLANCGLPATSGFVGEFMVILGAVKFNFWIGMLAATALDFRCSVFAVAGQTRDFRRDCQPGGERNYRISTSANSLCSACWQLR